MFVEMSCNRVLPVLKAIARHQGFRNPHRFYGVVAQMTLVSQQRCTPMISLLPSSISYGRSYATKNKAKGNVKKKSVKVSDAELGEVIDVEKLRRSMNSALDGMKDDYVKQLSLRSSGNAVESMVVSFEGSNYEIQEIAQISRKGQQTIVINMIAFPQMAKTVMDTLKKSALNLNPQQEGTTIYVPVPKVTKEHREILAKKAKHLFISCRDSVRKTQERYIKTVKDSDVSDDVSYSAIDQIRSLGDEYVGTAEKIMKTKTEELLKTE